jgi:hypothetical protein
MYNLSKEELFSIMGKKKRLLVEDSITLAEEVARLQSALNRTKAINRQLLDEIDMLVQKLLDINSVAYSEE